MNAENKAYVDRVNNELNQLKNQIRDFETLAKAKDEHDAIDFVNQLRNTHQKMEKQRQAVLSSADAEMKQELDAINKGIGKLKADLSTLAAKLKSGPHTKAS
jgi:chromosome segregation ATPase